MPDIVLATINAKYHHASLALRTLYANLGDLRERAQIEEFTASQASVDIVERLLSLSPKVVGLSVYVWNVAQTTEVVALLKRLRPDLPVVIGGPEVSHEADDQTIVNLSDYCIQGEGEFAFRGLCAYLLKTKDAPQLAPPKIMPSTPPDISKLVFPYRYYNEEDIAHRTIYVEASRGCPYKCEFCLSSLDQGVRHFDVDAFLTELESLIERGAMHFKFIDRTFNLKIAISQQILQFFLDRYKPGMLLHFEMVPDRLPEALRELIAAFEPGALQFEVGVQTLNDDIAKHISRRQNVKKMRDNLHFLRQDTGVHVHADLIIGLPGEDIESFGRGLDELFEMGPQEIQVGVLKRLRGTPIRRHTEAFGMRYDPHPPYTVLQTDAIDFASMQRMRRFAMIWDRVINRGNFPHTAPLLWGASPPFESILALSDWVYKRTGRVHAIALNRMAVLLHTYLLERIVHPGGDAELDVTNVEVALANDYARAGRGLPKPLAHCAAMATVENSARRQAHRRRQDQHL